MAHGAALLIIDSSKPGLAATAPWIVGLNAAIWIIPFNWNGKQYQIHSQVLAALFRGGIIVSLPIGHGTTLTW
jgi:hypothetical protein